jgi:hypothetical protein
VNVDVDVVVDVDDPAERASFDYDHVHDGCRASRTALALEPP